jgi:hypothetical protein
MTLTVAPEFGVAKSKEIVLPLHRTPIDPSATVNAPELAGGVVVEGKVVAGVEVVAVVVGGVVVGSATVVTITVVSGTVVTGTVVTIADVVGFGSSRSVVRGRSVVVGRSVGCGRSIVVVVATGRVVGMAPDGTTDLAVGTGVNVPATWFCCD